jgi:hypothetical protein
MECYRFEKLEYKSGLLDDCVDATYIIHLEDNGRLPHIHEQLQKFQPSRTVYVAINRGFKNCEKKLPEAIPSHDLIHAFLTAFKHAEQNGYKNILVLEDDFIFDDAILEKDNTDSICKFIKGLENEPFLYSLGCLPYIQVPISYKHRVALIKSATHACIYTKSIRTQLMLTSIKKISDWDIYTNFNVKQYIYHIPLCYQLITETENSKHWKYLPLLTELNNASKSFLNMDTTPIPGFQYYYWFSLIMFFILLLIVLYVAYFVARRMRSIRIRRQFGSTFMKG